MKDELRQLNEQESRKKAEKGYEWEIFYVATTVRNRSRSVTKRLRANVTIKRGSTIVGKREGVQILDPVHHQQLAYRESGVMEFSV